MKARLIAAVAVLSFVAVVAGCVVASGNGANGPQNVVMVYNGPSVTNDHAVPDTAAFTAWCSSDGGCSPSVKMPAVDAATGQALGQIYVWTKNFNYSSDGQSVCFGEFVWFALADGDVYADSGNNGTCGGFMAASLKPPTHITDFGQVIAGGGDGTIVDGTGKYKQWTGTYTDRVFVEFNFSGGANYYDQLFWSLHKT